jgi:hypothetical protein
LSTFGAIRSNSTQLKADASDPTKVRIAGPSYTTAERDAIATPVDGEHIWNSTDNCLNHYNGVVWTSAPVIDVFSRYRASGTSAVLSTRYASLAAAQAAYPLAGVTSLSDTIDWAAVQQAINENIGQASCRILQFGDKDYFTGNGKTFGVRYSGDISAALHLLGGGNVGTRFTQLDQTVPCFEIHNTFTSGNMRDVTLENLHFWEGKHGLFIRRAAYNHIEHCATFRPGSNDVNTGQDFFSIRTELSHNNFFNAFQARHNVTSDFLYADNSTLFFSNCQIGEDSGGIILETGAAVYFVNCNANELSLETTPAGAFSAAGGAIYVGTLSTLNWIGGRIVAKPNRACLILGNNCTAIQLIGCHLGGTLVDESLIGLRIVPTNFSAVIADVDATLPSGGAIIKRYDTADPIRNTQIDNLRVRVAGGVRSTIWADDSLFDPQYNNEVGSILVIPS